MGRTYFYPGVRVDDFSDEVYLALQDYLEQGCQAAMEFYRDELRSKIRYWGSKSIGGDLRLREYHSSPGEPPLRQTSNLYNSIEIYVGGRYKKGLIGQIKEPYVNAYCFTTVSYAPGLETGQGIVQEDQLHKIFTNFRLANPVHTQYGARPAWLPTFNKRLRNMLARIKRGGS